MACKLLFLASVVVLFSAVSVARGDLILGVISDFQDGTDQGWSGGAVVNLGNSGPLGVGDNPLQLSNGGVAGFFAMHNTGVNGMISP